MECVCVVVIVVVISVHRVSFHIDYLYVYLLRLFVVVVLFVVRVLLRVVIVVFVVWGVVVFGLAFERLFYAGKKCRHTRDKVLVNYYQEDYQRYGEHQANAEGVDI